MTEVPLEDLLKQDLLARALEMQAELAAKPESVKPVEPVIIPESAIAEENAMLKEEIIDLKEQGKVLSIKIGKMQEEAPKEDSESGEVYKKALVDLIGEIRGQRIASRSINRKIEKIEQLLK